MIISAFLFVAAILASREWQNQWFILAAFSISVLAWKVLIPKVGRLPTVLICYCLLSAAYTWLFRENRYIQVEQYDQQAIRYFSVDAATKLLLILWPMFILAKHERPFRWLGELGAVLVIYLNCGSLLWMAFKQYQNTGKVCAIENSCGGMLGNPSMSMSFMVALLPIALVQSTKSSRWILISLVAVSVLLSKSSIALGMLALLAVVYAAYRNIYLIFLAPSAMALGYGILGKDLLSDGLRFKMWGFFMERWASNPANWLWGMGYGSFGVFSRHIQRGVKQLPDGSEIKLWAPVHEDHWWTWMHNDWLQIIFELGIIGILLAVPVYFLALKRLHRMKYNHALLSLAMFGILMVFNYPLHVHLSSLFGAWLMMVALVKFPENQLIYGESKC